MSFHFRPEGGPPNPNRILIVDDVADNCEMLARRLQRQGFATDVAAGGQAALLTVESAMPDLVLLDHMMPDISGIEVLRQLRLTYGAAQLPVIMVTAVTEEDTMVEAIKAGANDYVTKPISLPVLLARMDAQLARKRAESELRAANAALDYRVTMRLMESDELAAELAEERVLRAAAERELAKLRREPVA